MSASADQINDSSILLREDSEGIATLTLNRPQQYNPLSSEMLAALQAALDDIGKDESVRVVILAATGKAFCAGHDLREMRANDDPQWIKALFQRCAQVMLTINRLPQPVIARVHGIATAAGCQMVAACDLALAAEEARFAVSGIGLGLFCSAPAVSLSRNMLRKQALQMLLTGDFVDANRARELGLVNEVHPQDELVAASHELAAKIVAKSSHAIGIGKQMFYRQLDMELADAYEYASEIMACNMDSHDAREGFDAFLEKRSPTWKHK